MSVQQREDIIRSLRPVSWFEVLDRAFELIRQRPSSMLLLSILSWGPFGVALFGWMFYIHYNQSSWGTDAYIIYALPYVLGLPLTIYMYHWSKSAQIYLAYRWILGDHIQSREALAYTARRPESFLMLGPLYVLSVLVGMLFYIAPGAFIVARWGMLPAVVAIESESRFFQPIMRTFRLGEGAGGRLLLLFLFFRGAELLLWINLLLLKYLILFVGHNFFGSELSALRELPYSSVLLYWLTLILLAPLKNATLAMTYVDSRVRNEGWDLRLWLDLLIGTTSQEVNDAPDAS
ncbi:MAG TPA: hypothetical protein DCE42_10550 [Myxococcales bacterium]|nr:hypothetical protein [Deltaproteobacteria bacterium]HAA55185.1 hypothetical protein [Myxococcales bacterium]|tara:strand:- start:2147 stop:3019 length:873 start_codon:yes stop_codon:yes gene_type:complete